MKHLLLTIAALCTLSGASAQALPQDTVTRKGTLPNGLTYYVRKNLKTPGQADFYIAQRVGSVLEEENQRGLAHFLEHMCFNGTTHYPGDRLLRYLEGIGVKFGEQLNAYTSIDETVYNINNVPTGRTSTVDSVLLILRDWSCDLLLEDKEIDKERGVIHEEWRQGSSAQTRIMDRRLPTLMSGSRPGNRLPIGLMSVVDSFPYQALRDYYEKWYRPDLQAIIVVGDIDPERTEQKIAEMFSTVTMPENAAERIFYGVPDNEQPIVVTDHDPEQSIALVALMQKHQPLWDEDRKNTVEYVRHEAAMHLLGSMLRNRVQEITLKPETPYLGLYFDEGEFLVSKVTKSTNVHIIPKEGQMYPAVTSAVRDLCDVLDYGFVQSELDRSRATLTAAIDLQYQNRNKRENETFVQQCLDNFLEKEPMLSIEDETALYRRILPTITVEEVNALYARLVSRNMHNTVIFSMNPEKEGYVQPAADSLLLAVEAGMAAETKAYEDEMVDASLMKEMPAPGSVRKSRKGHFGGKELLLSNGVRVVMLPTTHSDNEILMQAYSPGGTSRYGLEDGITLKMAEELCSVSRLGGFRQTDLRKILAGKQAQASGSIGMRNEYLSGGSSRRDLETMLQLTCLQFQPLQPDMDAAQNLMTQYYTVLQGKENDPMQQFSDSVSATIYGHNPRHIIMHKEMLPAVNYERALEIWADRFADASDFTFLFVGTFDEDSLTDLCCRYLASLPARKRNDAPVNTDLLKRKGIVDNIYRTRMEQAQCVAVVALHAPAKGNNLKDDLALSILAQALDMSYIKSIREDLGASYGIGVNGSLGLNNDGKWEYNLTVSGAVKPEMYDTCLVLIREEMESVAANGIPAEYMQRIKQYMQKTYSDNINRNGAWLSYMQEYYRYGIDYRADYLPTLEKVSQKDIMRVMKAILKAGNRTTVVMLPEEKQTAAEEENK